MQIKNHSSCNQTLVKCYTPSDWIITTPAGFEGFFASAADEFSKEGNPDESRLIQIHREHGIELL